MNLICLGRKTRVCTVNANLQCKMAQSSRINTTPLQKQSLPHILPRTPYRLAPLRNVSMFSLQVRMSDGIDEDVICGTKCHSHKYEIKTLLSDVLWSSAHRAKNKFETRRLFVFLFSNLFKILQRTTPCQESDARLVKLNEPEGKFHAINIITG